MLRIRLGNINLGKGQDGPNRFIPKRCWTKKVTQILKNISDKWKSKGADCFLPCIIKKIHIVKLYCFTSVWAKNWIKLLKPHKIYSSETNAFWPILSQFSGFSWAGPNILSNAQVSFQNSPRHWSTHPRNSRIGWSWETRQGHFTMEGSCRDNLGRWHCSHTLHGFIFSCLILWARVETEKPGLL